MTHMQTQRAALDESFSLNAPSLPQANQAGVIDVAALSPGEFVLIRIPNGQIGLWHPTPGDTIWAYLMDSESGVIVTSEIAVVVGDPHASSWDAKVDPAKIPNGTYKATYQKWNLVNDVATSSATPVAIQGSTAVGYPGPTFPEASDGVLYYSTIATVDGAHVRTNYGLQPGDQVTFYWQGFDKWGNVLPKAAYKTQSPMTVAKADYDKGYIADKIPLLDIRAVGDLGSGAAYYEVLRQGAKHTSLKTNVVTSWSDIASLQVTSTVGAPKASIQPTDLYPCNCGTVFGEPGLDVTISVTAGQIVEADPGDPTTYKTRLDSFGLASFTVSSGDRRVSIITVYANKVAGMPSVPATFGDYLDGSAAAGIEKYAYTTYVPSDGVTACTIYFQVMDAFVDQTVTVTIVDTNCQATIVGADLETPKTRVVYLNDDGSGSAQIVDKCAEKVQVAFSVTGQAQMLPLQYPVEFISFPSV